MRDPDLRGVLREEASRHTPDPAAMMDRIEQRRRTRGQLFRLPIGPRARRTVAVLRPIAAGLAVTGVLVAGAAGLQLANHSPALEDRVAATKSPSPSPTAPVVVPTRCATGRPPVATSRPPHSPTRSTSSIAPPAAVTSQPGFLTASAVLNRYSIAAWSQNDLTLTTTETLTALDVTIKVAITDGVTDTGRWSTISTGMIASTVTRTPTELVYHFALNAGATLSPGSYTLAVQYLHAGPRDVTADSYTVTAKATTQTKLSGHFTA